MKLQPQRQISSSLLLPGDKSISHRCLILSSLAQGISILKNVSLGKDVLSTQNILKTLGRKIENITPSDLKVHGEGLFFNPVFTCAEKPSVFLDCGNAGTLMRLMMGVLSGQTFSSTLIGDESLQQRPMDRVADPLRSLNACIELQNRRAPVRIFPSKLKGHSLQLQVPSAQVKSAVMLAALYAEAPVEIESSFLTRDHTENLFPYYGIRIEKKSPTGLRIFPHPPIHPVNYTIPSDPSAAAFWLVAAAISSQPLTVTSVGLNPSRLGFLDVFKACGLSIQTAFNTLTPEPVGTIFFRPQTYQGFEIPKNMLPRLIDEIPILCLLASQAQTDSIIHDAEELRFKETDRIVAIENLFHSLGMQVHVENHTLKIPGQQKIKGGCVDSMKDHRIAMTAAIASYACHEVIEIQNAESAEISDPYFWKNIFSQKSQAPGGVFIERVLE